MCWLQHRVRTVYYVMYGMSCDSGTQLCQHAQMTDKIWRSPGTVDPTNTLSDGKAQVRTDESRRE